MSATSEMLFFFVTLTIVILILYYYFDRKSIANGGGRHDNFFAFGLALTTFTSDGAEGIICGFLAAIGCFVTIWIVLFFAWIRNFCRSKPLPQNEIFNISSRVQGQENHWNPSDLSRVSISQMNKPPQYDDAPPSYDEAMRLASLMSGESSTSGNVQIETVPQTVPDLIENVSDSSQNFSVTNQNVSDPSEIVPVSNENVPTSVVVEEPKPTTSTGIN